MFTLDHWTNLANETARNCCSVQRVKWRAMQRCLEVLCFLRRFGLCGLERWAIAQLSPRRRIARLAMRRRALKLPPRAIGLVGGGKQ